MGKGGRRPVLDEIKKREICAILSVGCSRRTAANYVRCAVDTIRRTAERDSAFNEQLKQAESRHEILHLKNINEAAKSKQYWRAAAWALERKYPQRYGQRHPATITVDQISHLMAQFAEIVMDEVPAQCRKNVLARVEALAASLEQLPARKAEP